MNLPARKVVSLPTTRLRWHSHQAIQQKCTRNAVCAEVRFPWHLWEPTKRVPMRVSQFLEEQHVSFETVLHPPAFTAQKRARFLHIPGRQVIKCVLLASGSGFILAILRAIDHVDLEILAKYLGAPVRLADEDD